MHHTLLVTVSLTVTHYFNTSVQRVAAVGNAIYHKKAAEMSLAQICTCELQLSAACVCLPATGQSRPAAPKVHNFTAGLPSHSHSQAATPYSTTSSPVSVLFTALHYMLLVPAPMCACLFREELYVHSITEQNGQIKAIQKNTTGKKVISMGQDLALFFCERSGSFQ